MVQDKQQARWKTYAEMQQKEEAVAAEDQQKRKALHQWLVDEALSLLHKERDPEAVYVTDEKNNIWDRNTLKVIGRNTHAATLIDAAYIVLYGTLENWSAEKAEELRLQQLTVPLFEEPVQE
ncbi:FKBP-type peptidyl-prolyl cis-trans isomerase [Salibacterium aidingense]|uniref:hypothetical protein n=1 Tax=Salibacterium aidingense TaxID=384933 RepID=UPI0004200B4E|nr:hypothetical protein [Salibacterium aidingense]